MVIDQSREMLATFPSNRTGDAFGAGLVMPTVCPLLRPRSNGHCSDVVIVPM
jgi:hypothetical protein